VLEASGLYYPNRFARFFFLGAGDALGTAELNLVLAEAAITAMPPDDLARAFDFAGLAAFNAALEAIYGARGGRSVALRIGRAWYGAGLDSFGLLAGLADTTFFELPEVRRVHLSLEALAAVFNAHSDQRCKLTMDAARYYLTVEHSPMVWGRSLDAPACHALVGLIQEMLYRATDQQGYFHVVEQRCRAVAGEACVFAVNKTPMGKR
jgi:predicted hydrocarbon binding protein